jgi:hypothetical protein
LACARPLSTRQCGTAVQQSLCPPGRARRITRNTLIGLTNAGRQKEICRDFFKPATDFVSALKQEENQRDF